MNQVEQDVMKKIMTYTIALRQWQTENKVESESGDPLLGRWMLSEGGGLLEFCGGDFHWYRDPEDLSGDARWGKYSVTPGVLINTGFILDRGGEATRCFSVFMQYIGERTDGRDMVTDFRGLLFVEQMGRVDELGVYNHRTDTRFLATRVKVEG